MTRVGASLALGLALATAVLQSACALNGQPKASVATVPAPQPKPAADTKPAPPPEPLSVPQTQVQLPPPQPVNPEAVPLPKPEEPAAVPIAPRPARRVSPPQPKPETPAPSTAAPAETGLAPVQELLTADERKRYQESADSRKSEIHQLMTQAKLHRLTAEQNREIKRIQSLVAQSDDVEKRGDMRQADALAERALILSRELTHGK
jgi:hypothetical protein